MACSSIEEKKEDDWRPVSTERIEHTDVGNMKIQVIYSTLNIDLLDVTDTSIIIQKFDENLLIEKIHYKLVDGDSSKWLHTINNYNFEGRLTEEIDSANGSLMRHELHFYENDTLVRSESLTVFPNYNDSMQLISYDTTRIIQFSYYDDEGRRNRVMSLYKDELTSKLNGTMILDTAISFIEYDEQGNRTRSISITNGDTASIALSEYDEFNREIKSTDISEEIGLTTLQFEYDEQGNRISELLHTNYFKELTLIKYNELNRPISQTRYKAYTLNEISQ
jgi:YD repeat-containing protein